MNLRPSHDHEVVIVGAGPVGLFLACELRLAGRSVLVLEQGSDPRLKRAPFGLRGLSVPTVEAFDRRNLLDALRARVNARAIASAAPRIRNRQGGHFAGLDFALEQIDQAGWPYRLSHDASPMAADVQSIEAVLTTRALELGAVIRSGCRVRDLEATDDQMIVCADGQSFRARWVVGCDGARSIVRKAGGFQFSGTEPEFTGYFVQVELADPTMLEAGHHNTETGTYIYEAPGTIRMVEFDRGIFHRAQPITRDHVEAVLRRISGRAVELTGMGLATTWTDRAYMATEYRRGRVLLAGDAAHIQSPLGGQGLNLGLGDAMNLGWKLAATILGKGDLGLLDSYQRERQPVAARILDWSRAQVALMRPDRGARALRSIMADLIATREGTTYFAERVWGVGIRYDLGSDHPLVGRSAPDIEFTDGTRLNERLRDGLALLMDFGENDAMRMLTGRCGKKVGYARCSAVDPLDLGAMLVRPDGFVAWAVDSAPASPCDLRALPQALRQLDCT